MTNKVVNSIQDATSKVVSSKKPSVNTGTSPVKKILTSMALGATVGTAFSTVLAPERSPKYMALGLALGAAAMGTTAAATLGLGYLLNNVISSISKSAKTKNQEVNDEPAQLSSDSANTKLATVTTEAGEKKTAFTIPKNITKDHILDFIKNGKSQDLPSMKDALLAMPENDASKLRKQLALALHPDKRPNDQVQANKDMQLLNQLFSMHDKNELNKVSKTGDTSGTKSDQSNKGTVVVVPNSPQTQKLSVVLPKIEGEATNTLGKSILSKPAESSLNLLLLLNNKKDEGSLSDKKMVLSPHLSSKLESKMTERISEISNRPAQPNANAMNNKLVLATTKAEESKKPQETVMVMPFQTGSGEKKTAFTIPKNITKDHILDFIKNGKSQDLSSMKDALSAMPENDASKLRKQLALALHPDKRPNDQVQANKDMQLLNQLFSK